MNSISAISSLAPIQGVVPVRSAPPGPVVAAAHGIGQRDSLSRTVSDLRARLGTPNAHTAQLQRTTSLLDAADETLAHTLGLLDQARSALASAPGPELDTVLDGVDSTSAKTLGEGVTLRAGNESILLRPVGAEHLGAVIESGRSHRLTDIRSGRSLDAAAHPGAARRSIEAASGEVTAMRTQMSDFRSAVLLPAQRDTLSALRAGADTGPVSAAQAAPIAASIRSSMLSSAPMGDLDASAVFALLASKSGLY